MFVRIKRISGKEYAYAVENVWTKGRARQKVRKYLGPVVRCERRETTPFAQWRDVDLERYIDNTPLKRVLRDVVRHTLVQHGFSGRPLSVGGVTVDLRSGPMRRDKPVVLAMGEGFLSRDSLRALLNVQAVEERRRGEHLAELFMRAGIPIEKQVFVLLYRKLYNI